MHHKQLSVRAPCRARPRPDADWLLLERTADDDGRISTTTRGLSRFGVPELRVVAVEAPEVPAWDAVLTGLGHRLVAADPPSRVTTVELSYSDETAEVTGTPVADLFEG